MDCDIDNEVSTTLMSTVMVFINSIIDNGFK